MQALRSRLPFVSRKDVTILWLTQVLSGIGDQIFVLALPWMVYATSKSALSMSAIRVAEYLPYLTLAFVVGILADSLDRRMMMALAVTLQAGLVALTAWLYPTGRMPMWTLYLVGFTLSSATFVFMSAQEAVLPSLVTAEDLPRVNAQFKLVTTIVALVGPGLAGVLIDAIGPTSSLWIDLLTFFPLVVGLMCLRVPESTAPRKASWTWANVTGGLIHINAVPVLRAAMILIAGINIGLGLMNGLLIFHLRDTMHFQGRATGLVLATGAMGSLIAAFVIPWASKRYSGGRQMLLGSLLAGLGVAGFATQSYLVLVGLSYAVQSFGIMLINTNLSVVVQQSTPGEAMGRVFASVYMLARCMAPVAAAMAGVLGNWLGTRAVFGFASVLIVSVTLASTAGALAVRPASLPGQADSARTG